MIGSVIIFIGFCTITIWLCVEDYKTRKEERKKKK